MLLPQIGTAGTCSIIEKSITRKQAAFDSFREQNQANHASDLEREKSCQSRGAAVSAELASVATAKTCVAETDAAAVNQHMFDLGSSCVADFGKIHDQQKELHKQFDSAKTDLEEATGTLEADELTSMFCGPEIAQAKDMIQNFLALQEEIVAVQGRIQNGEVSYGKFTDTARQLQNVTGGRGKDCATAESAFFSAAKLLTGTSKPDESTVTGVAKALAQKAGSTAAIAATFTGKGDKGRESSHSDITASSITEAPSASSPGQLARGGKEPAGAKAGRAPAADWNGSSPQDELGVSTLSALQGQTDRSEEMKIRDLVNAPAAASKEGSRSPAASSSAERGGTDNAFPIEVLIAAQQLASVPHAQASEIASNEAHAGPDVSLFDLIHRVLRSSRSPAIR